MLPVHLHAFVSVPREEVFDVIVDMSVREAWASDAVEEVRLTSPRSSGVGAGARYRVRGPLRAQWAETRIAEAERPRTIVEEGRAGRLGRNATGAAYELTPQAGGLTRVDLTVWIEPANPFERLAEGLGTRRRVRRRYGRALERLRRLLEERGDEPIERTTIAGYEPIKAPRFGAPAQPNA